MRISDWSSDVCSSDLLDAMAPQLVGRDGDGDGSLWTGIRRELGELFVVSAAGTKKPRASERLDRARRYLSGGQADQEIAGIEGMQDRERGTWGTRVAVRGEIGGYKSIV